VAEGGRVRVAAVLAVAALVVHVASVFLPLHPFGDPMTWSDAFPAGLGTRLQIGFAITIFFVDVVVLVGLVFLATGRSAIASGMFLAAAITETLIAAAGPLYTTIHGRPLILLGMRLVVALLLFGAAVAAMPPARSRTPPVPPTPRID
jgi:hypothetical protein